MKMTTLSRGDSCLSTQVWNAKWSNGETWTRSNLAWADIHLRASQSAAVFLRDILARLKHIIGATAGRYYIHIASSILPRTVIDLCQRRAIHCFLRSRAASSGCSENATVLRRQREDHKRRRFTSAVRQVLKCWKRNNVTLTAADVHAA